MNKRIIIVLSILLACLVCNAQTTLDLRTLRTLDTKEVSIPTQDIEEVQDGIIVTYHFNSVNLYDDYLFPGKKSVEIKGFWQSFDEGMPAVLHRWDSFVVPDYTAKVVVLDSSYVEFPLELSPARRLLLNTSKEIHARDNVRDVSPYHGFFPNSVIPSTKRNEYKKNKIIDVCLSPVQYDYDTHKVRIFSMVKYKVCFNTAVLRNSTRNRKYDDDPFLSNITLNAGSVRDFDPTDPPLELENKHYLILSVPKYASAVSRFAEWKKTLGFDVHVETPTSWDTTAVKSVVSNFDNTYSLDYLLILGGHNDVPPLMRSRFIDGETRTYPTDYYYGHTGSGNIPGTYRGRIPVNTLAEADVVVDKIINYERNPVDDEDFYNTGINCAYFQDSCSYFELNGKYYKFNFPDSCEEHRFTQTSEEIRDYMIEKGKIIHRIYNADTIVGPKYYNIIDFYCGGQLPENLWKPTYPWTGNYADINSKINQKAFYVFHRGHGEIGYWDRPRYTTEHIDYLNNGQYLPVVFSITCLTGKFNENNCFCEHFLKKSNGGCVGIYGASEVSFSGPNDVLAESMFDAIWPSTSSLRPHWGSFNPVYGSTPNPTYRLGQILNQGLTRVSEAYSGVSSLFTQEEYHCFGDPSMMIYTENPTAFNNGYIIRQNGTISVYTGFQPATITYYNRRTGVIESFVTNNHTHADDPEISVCVHSHNRIPLIDNGTLFIQNQNLNSNHYYYADTIKIGNHVTTTQTQGDVNFQSGDYKIGGKEIELHPGTTISAGASLEINNN